MAASDKVSTTVLPTRGLPSATWDEIWSLIAEFYDVERAFIEAELRSRERIALFRMNDALLGMASLHVHPARFRGRAIAVISTTHVLLRENWRGRNLTQWLGLRTYLRTRLRYPMRPIYWFFDAFSYKSYLLLPRNFVEYWPRHDQPTPEARAALIDELASRAYGPAWRPARGVAVRSGRIRLREAAAPLPSDGDPGPDVAFFARANPGHAEGDMLICLCPLTLRNWLSVARKMRERRRRHPPH
jgi:hypothetical protein